MTLATAQSGDPPATTKRTALQELAALALDADAPEIARDADALSDRLAQGRFYVACVGQFKRGKSSLINALVGDPVLPVGVVPVTAVVTVVRYGPARAARIRRGTGEWEPVSPDDLPQFLSQERNPENREGVTAAEVFVPSPLLRAGICLVDTPGVGSVFLGNTEATWSFVPHVDVALVVLGADPPISADELELVEDIAVHSPHFLVALNKTDKIVAAERAAAIAFTRETLASRLGNRTIPLFEVSATERLAGGGKPRDWSGFVGAFETLAREAGADLVRAAESRGVEDLAARLRYQLGEERGALTRPIEESERRVAELRTCVADADRALNELRPLLAAEQERLRREFSDLRDRFVDRARPEARAELERAIDVTPITRGPKLRTAAVDLAHDVARHWLDRWRPDAEPTAETLYAAAMARFVDLGNGFLERLAEAGDPALRQLPRALGAERGFRVNTRMHYAPLMSLTTQGPVGWLLDVARPRGRQLQKLHADVGTYLMRLLEVNANRFTASLYERVLESRRSLEAELKSHLDTVRASAERALARARERRSRGEDAVREQVARIDALLERLVRVTGGTG